MLMQPMIFKSLTGYAKIGDRTARCQLSLLLTSLEALGGMRLSGDPKQVMGHCNSILFTGEKFILQCGSRMDAQMRLAVSGVSTLMEQARKLKGHLSAQAPFAGPGEDSGQKAGSEPEIEEICKDYKVAIRHVYNQFNDPRIRPANKDHWDDLTSPGWCLGMSIHWLGIKKQGGDFWKWAETDDAMKKFRFLMATQMMQLSSIGGNMSPSARLADLMQKFRFNRTEDLYQEDYQAPSGAHIVDSIFARSGRFSLICFQGNGGHITALYRDEKGRPHFMDPNFGEFSFRSRKLAEDWFDELIYMYYDHHTTCWVEHFA